MTTRYALCHRNVTLMGATPEHVFFCVTDPGVDVCDTKVRNTMMSKQVLAKFGDNSSVQAALAHLQRMRL